MGVKLVLEETCVKEEWIYSSSVSLVNNEVIFHEAAKFEMIQPLRPRPHSQNIQNGFEGKSSGNPYVLGCFALVSYGCSLKAKNYLSTSFVIVTRGTEF